MESLVENYDGITHALGWSDGTARTVAELQEYEQLSDADRKKTDGFDFHTVLVGKLLKRKQLPTCGVHGNLVRCCQRPVFRARDIRHH